MSKDIKVASTALAKMTNVEIWDKCRKFSPSFAQHTSKGTAEMFTDKGFEAIRMNDLNVLNEFFEVSLRVAFQFMNVSRAKNPLENSGLVHYYANANGGFIQRMAIDTIKPVSPAYNGLKNGDSVDPFVVRKPKTSERFFEQNFDYQSFITIQDFQIKTIFINEYGMGEFVSGIMEGLANGYKVQEYENVLEALNKAINSTTWELQDTQKVVSAIADINNATDEELINFILTAKNLASVIETSAQTSAFNAAKFLTSVDKEDLVMLIRPTLKNQINVKLMTGAFNPDRLSLPFSVQEVENFGGIEYYKEAGFTNKVYPAYDAKTGEQIGWADTENQTVAQYTDEQVFPKDTNSDIVAIIAQKGLVFENKQNGYIVQPIQNPRGLYTNYWASSPNNTISVDPYYSMIVIKKA